MIITTITVTTMTEPITLSLVHVWGKKTGIVSVCLKSLSRVLKNHQMQMYQMKYMYACALHVYHSFSNFHARVRQHTCWRLHTYIHVCTMLQPTTYYMYNVQVEHRQYMQNTSANRWLSYYCGYHATQCMVRWVVPQCLCTHTYTHTPHVYTRTRIHTHTHTHTQTRIHTHTQNTHSHQHTQAHTHTHTHTHIHTVSLAGCQDTNKVRV